ncbi:hypothetical protein ACFQ9X_14460 [Catenulispora yoronensis]
MLATAAGPMVFGTRVAAGFLGRLVRSGTGVPGTGVPRAGLSGTGVSGTGVSAAAVSTTLLIGVAAALAVVLLLSLRGLPTSLTLAVVGGLAGAGLGAGLPVPAGSVATVLLAAALAPIISALIAWLVTRSLRLAGTRRSTAAVATGRTHRVAFPLQCLAYGANDGQKMIALFAVAGGSGLGVNGVAVGGVGASGVGAGGAGVGGAGSVRLGVVGLMLCGVLFGLGAVLGLPRAAASWAPGSCRCGRWTPSQPNSRRRWPCWGAQRWASRCR